MCWMCTRMIESKLFSERLLCLLPFSLKKEEKKSVGQCQSIFLVFLFLLLIFSLHYPTSSSWILCSIALIQVLCKASGNTTRGSHQRTQQWQRSIFWVSAFGFSEQHQPDTVWSKGTSSAPRPSLVPPFLLLVSYWLGTGAWGNTGDGFPSLKSAMSWLECDIISLGWCKHRYQRDVELPEFFLLQFNRALMVKVSCKWAHLDSP